MRTTFEQQQAANEKQRLNIEAKLEAGKKLTLEEQYFLCDNLIWDVRSIAPECEDCFYHDAFIIRDAENVPDFIIYTDENERKFTDLVSSWPKEIEHPTTDLGKAERKEVKKELKELKNQIRETDPAYKNRFFNLMAWSKFRYLLIKKIFDLQIKSTSYALGLNGETILIDYETYSHILARHFGHGMKPYNSKKDHFYGIFRHDQLHLDLEAILTAIDQSGVYIKDSTAKVTFRFKGEIFRLFNVFQSPKSPVKRLSTLFPVSDATILSELATTYKEQYINEDLAVFVKLVK